MEKLSKKALKEQYKNKVAVGGVFRIKCGGSGAVWLRSTVDMQGSKNRFDFSQLNDSYPEPCMRDAWTAYGASSFSFEVLEEIKMRKTQTQREFAEDINVLLLLWTERVKSEQEGESRFGTEN